MKKIIALSIIGFSLSLMAQTTVNLPAITLSEKQVAAMTWHWQNYTNSWTSTNSQPLAKGAWFISESTNLVFNAINRKTMVYEQSMNIKLANIYSTNAVKRAAIEAILNEP